MIGSVWHMISAGVPQESVSFYVGYGADWIAVEREGNPTFARYPLDHSESSASVPNRNHSGQRRGACVMGYTRGKAEYGIPPFTSEHNSCLCSLRKDRHD